MRFSKVGVLGVGSCDGLEQGVRTWVLMSVEVAWNGKSEPKRREDSLRVRGWQTQCAVSEQEWDEEDDHLGEWKEWQL